MPNRSPTDASNSLDEAIERSFALVAYQVNRHLIDHMLRITRELSTDFESLVLWGVLSHQNVAHLLPPGTLPASVLDEFGHLEGDRTAELRPLRVRDLVQITGIPRETVRRKLAMLESAGRIQRVDDGWIVNREAVGADLRAFTRETVRRLLMTAQLVTETLEAAAPPRESD